MFLALHIFKNSIFEPNDRQAEIRTQRIETTFVSNGGEDEIGFGLWPCRACAFLEKRLSSNSRRS